MNSECRLSEHLASPSEATLSHSNEFDGLRLSPHFTLAELCKTSHKTKDGNIPSRVAIENLKRLCQWLEKLRFTYNEKYVKIRNEEPIVINSGFRSWEVNKLAGGSSTSNHLVGCAADIRCLGKEQALRYATILLDIADNSKEDFDEIIIEVRGSTIWVHFAVRPKMNRRKIVFDVK